MKVINVLTALALVCLPTLAVANNLPFVGTRDFHVHHFDGHGGYKQIQITKNGNVKIYNVRYNFDTKAYQRSVLHSGKYKNIIHYYEQYDGETDHVYLKVVGKNQIAYTDKNGRILNECDGYCVSELGQASRGGLAGATSVR